MTGWLFFHHEEKKSQWREAGFYKKYILDISCLKFFLKARLYFGSSGYAQKKKKKKKAVERTNERKERERRLCVCSTVYVRAERKETTIVETELEEKEGEREREIARELMAEQKPFL